MSPSEVAQDTDDVMDMGTVVGTYGYMAPEQFRGTARPASDLFALGGTLLYLLSGIHTSLAALPRGMCIHLLHAGGYVAAVCARFSSCSNYKYGHAHAVVCMPQLPSTVHWSHQMTTMCAL